MRSSSSIVSLVTAIVAILCGLGASPDAQVFKTGVETVEVTVTVTDAAGRLIGGLKADDFEVFEDGDPQPIKHFTGDRVPLSLGMLVDISDSMRGKPIVDARAALTHFVGELLDRRDEVFLGTFNHVPQPITAWMRPPSEVQGALDSRQPSGGTAIYDAIVASLDAFGRRDNGRAALVVISDGADTASDISVRQAQDRLRRTDAFVYAIAIDAEGAQRRTTRVNPDALRELTAPTGGYTEVVQSAGDLPVATERIALELNAQYSLGYVAPRPADGRWRSVRVRAKGEGLITRSRRGYYATPTYRR
ncbi:MAG: VWA domain-containing protein [Vicinamibacterales bacterium]